MQMSHKTIVTYNLFLCRILDCFVTQLSKCYNLWQSISAYVRMNNVCITLSFAHRNNLRKSQCVFILPETTCWRLSLFASQQSKYL